MTGTTAPKPLCLALIDTAVNRDGKIVRDELGSFDDLVAWGERIGLLDPERAEELRVEAAASEKPAARTLALARNLRAALRDLLTPGVPAAHIDVGIETLNAVVQRIGPTVRLQRVGDRISFAPGDTLESWLIGPLVISAMAHVVASRAQ